MQVYHYGAPPFMPDGTVDSIPRFLPTPVWPEAISREIRELREMMTALHAGKGETSAAGMARRVVLALIESSPEALAEIEKVVAETKAARENP